MVKAAFNYGKSEAANNAKLKEIVAQLQKQVGQLQDSSEEIFARATFDATPELKQRIGVDRVIRVPGAATGKFRLYFIVPVLDTHYHVQATYTAGGDADAGKTVCVRDQQPTYVEIWCSSSAGAFFDPALVSVEVRR